MPKVSVIVPIYNVAKYIERCARSLFEQTLDDIEFIFIDDKSPDNSISILKAVLEEYPQRVAQTIIYHMPCNSGLPTVRKQGIYMATGDFIANCDSDDWIDRNMYKLMYDEAVKNGCDIVKCNFTRCNEHFNRPCFTVPAGHFVEKDLLLSDLLKGSDMSSLCDKLIKRTLFYDYRILHPKDNMLEDYVVTTQLMYYSKKVGYLEDVLYFYYQNPDSICHQIENPSKIFARLEQKLRNANIIIGFLQEKGILHKYRKEIANLKYSVRAELLPLLPDRDYLHKWKNVYPDLKVWDLIGIRRKAAFILISLGLYPFRK